MTGALTRLATWPDIENLETQGGENVEILGGEVVLFPRSLARSGRSQGGLFRYVGGPFDLDPDGPGGWWIVIEPEVEFEPHEIFIPDIAGWRRSTLPQLPHSRPIHIRPDWVCEVLSPSTARIDRRHKAAVYLRHGVGHYWLLDVEARLLEAWENVNSTSWTVLGAYSDGDVVRIRPFDAIELDVGRLFPPV